MYLFNSSVDKMGNLYKAQCCIPNYHLVMKTRFVQLFEMQVELLGFVLFYFHSILFLLKKKKKGPTDKMWLLTLTWICDRNVIAND